MVTSTSKISSQKVKANHRRLVLAQIIQNGPVARTEIAKQSGLTLASVSRIARNLIDAGMVVEGETLSNSGPGRPFISLDVNETGAYVLSVSINRFSQIVTLANLKNQVVAKADLSIDDFTQSNVVIRAIGQAMNDLLAQSNIARWQLMGACVAAAGAVDPSLGHIISAPALGWQEVDLAAQLQQLIQLPVHVETLANAINLAETRFGISREYDHVVLYNLSLGIGASFIEDNRVVRGADHAAGAIGSMPMWRDQAGERITVDQVAGGWGVLAHKSSSPSNTALSYSASVRDQLMQTIENAEQGDKNAQMALQDAGQNMGEVLALVSHMMAPQVNIIAGPLANNKQYVEALERSAQCAAGTELRIIVSQMPWATAASWLAIHEFCMIRDIDVDKLVRGLAA